MALLFIFFLSSCSHIFKLPVDDPQAGAYVTRAVEANGDLKTIKGIGSLRFVSEDGTLTTRVVWAAEPPSKVRIDMVTPVGQSSPMFIADGRLVTIFSEERAGRQLKQRENALEPIVQVPVGIEFLTALLAGRFPPVSYTATRIHSVENENNSIELLDRWSMIIGRLTIGQATQKPVRYNHYGPDGTNQYQINWRSWKEIEGYLLPRTIEIITVGGSTLTLKMQRYFCNPDLSDDLFSVPQAD